MSAKNLNYYIQKFINLRVSRSAGVAPNKPILLLSVINAIATKQVQKNQIPLTAELIAIFLKLWSHLEPVRKPDIGLPFFHLIGDRFWHYKMRPGFELFMTTRVTIRTLNAIRETVEYAYLDPELWELLQNRQNRSVLTRVLINSWFGNKTDIKKLMQVNVFAELVEQLRLSGGKVYRPEEIQEEQTNILRDGTFRDIVVTTYNKRCALCGLHILNTLNQDIVDAAHIKPFSLFYDDRIDNGLSLCKNHHWAFDRGWFSINDDYTIIVADDLREESPHARPMQEFGGDRIILPAQHQYYPRLEALQWHRENVFDAA